MRISLFLLGLMAVVGCDNNGSATLPKSASSQPITDVVEESPQASPVVHEQSTEPSTPVRSAYEEFVAEHSPRALVVRRNQPFMLDEDTPLTVAEQPVHYWGVDEYQNLIMQYEEERNSRKRTVRSPIILPVKVKSLEGAPDGTIAGDAKVGSHTLHILSATDTECRYAVAKTDKE